jgi:molybdate transport system substrate-binding protein
MRSGARRTGWLVLLLLLSARSVSAEDIVVMTSGAFTAAYVELSENFARQTNDRFITATTTMGVGKDSIPSRLAAGERVDLVIVAGEALADLQARGLILPGSRVDLAQSRIAMAVRQGTVHPDISTVDALKRTLLAARSVAYSASVSGDYLVQELFPRLGIAGQMKSKSRRIEVERVGAVVARGEAEIGFQQLSELRPIAGIDVVGFLPAEVQRVTVFAAGIATSALHSEAARAFLRFLESPEAQLVIERTGLELMHQPVRR